MTGLTAVPRLTGRVVHSDVPLFEQYDAAMRRTVLNNLHGIPTDTPTYEKNGWTGDAQVGTPSMLAEFGMAKFFTKWLGDLADSQDAAGPLPVIETNYKNEVVLTEPEEEAKKFELPEGYEINLFASEKDFPELAKPVQFAFDTRGNRK